MVALVGLYDLIKSGIFYFDGMAKTLFASLNLETLIYYLNDIFFYFFILTK